MHSWGDVQAIACHCLQPLSEQPPSPVWEDDQDKQKEKQWQQKWIKAMMVAPPMTCSRLPELMSHRGDSGTSHLGNKLTTTTTTTATTTTTTTKTLTARKMLIRTVNSRIKNDFYANSVPTRVRWGRGGEGKQPSAKFSSPWGLIIVDLQTNH